MCPTKKHNWLTFWSLVIGFVTFVHAHHPVRSTPSVSSSTVKTTQEAAFGQSPLAEDTDYSESTVTIGTDISSTQAPRGVYRYPLDLLIAVSDTVNQKSFPNLTNLEMLVNEISDRVSTLTRNIGTEAFIKKVKILLPSAWDIPDEMATFETFSAAQVIIDDANDLFGDTPYTKQSGECMQEGEYVHLTPEFLAKAVNATIDNTTTKWGKPGDVIVHELFHQMFGVFDEYQEFEGTSYHEQGQLDVCPNNTHGKWIVPGPNQTVCEQGNDNCIFLPNTDNIPQSIMGYIHLNTTTHICTDLEDNNQTDVTHNRQADTMQNRKCNFRSVASVIREKLNSTSERVQLQGYTHVVYLKAKSKRRIVLLIRRKIFKNDMFRKSLGISMQSYIDDYLDIDDEIGIVIFNKTCVKTITNLTQTNQEPIQCLKGNCSLNCSLTATTESQNEGDASNPDSDCYIHNGIQRAMTLLDANENTGRGLEILVITTGKTPCCQGGRLTNLTQTIANGGSVINALLLTKGNGVNSTIVDFSNHVHGNVVHVSWDLRKRTGSKRRYRHLPIRLVLSRGSESNSRRSKSVKLKETNAKSGTFFVDPKSMTGIKFGLIKEAGINFNVSITLPNDTTIFPAFNNDEIILPEFPEPGRLEYQVYSNPSVTSGDILVYIKATSILPWTETIKARVWTNVTTLNFGEGITAPKIYGEVTRGYIPVLDASVTAVVTTANDTSVRIPMYDTGTGPDDEKDDGIYTAYLTTFDIDGSYSISVEVGTTNKTKINTRKNRNAAFDPSLFSSSSDSGNLIPLLLEEFERYASTPDISAENVPPGGDLFPPSAVTDLKLYMATDGDINLKFTPPGDDLNVGDASGFVVYLAYFPHEEHMTVFDNHTFSGTAPTIYTSNHKINRLETNSTHPVLYFTIRCFDDQVKYAPFSNIVSYTPSSGVAGTAGPTVTAQTITTTTVLSILPPTSKLKGTLSETVIIAIATCILISVIAISVTIILCMWLRRRNVNYKKTTSLSTQLSPFYDDALRWNPTNDPSDPYNRNQASLENQAYNRSQGSQDSQPYTGSHASHESGGSDFEYRPPDRNPPGLYDYDQHISLAPVPEDYQWQNNSPHLPVTEPRPSLPPYHAPPPPMSRPPLPKKDNRKSATQVNKNLQSQMLSPIQCSKDPDESPEDIYDEIKLRQSRTTQIYQKSVGEINRIIQSRKLPLPHSSSNRYKVKHPTLDNRISASSIYAEEGITDNLALPQFNTVNQTERFNMTGAHFSRGNHYGADRVGYR